MTDDQIISVVQAHKEGKKIQCLNFVNPIGDRKWYDVETPNWNFLFHEFRVAPEPRKPREFWIHHEHGNRWAIEGAPIVNCCNPIHVREVIE